MTFLPIVDRELSVSSRRPGTYWLRFWAALAMLAIWLLLLSNTRGASPARMGQDSLNALGILALAFSLFSGAFLTADCLSEEVREGTLGLLFLTDLKTFDVVLGKLAASSLNAFFGLLATFPILGLTLLLGGVTGGEFARLMLVFAATLFFSLGIGMFVSAISRDARQALTRAFLLIVVFAGVFPLIWWGQYLVSGPSTPGWVMLPSPVHAYIKAFDAYQRSSAGRQEFWASLATVFGIGLAGVVLAMFLLPRAWRRADSAPVAGSKRAGRTALNAPQSFGQRAAQMSANPYHWLAARDRAGGWFTLKTLFFLFPIWLIFLISTFFVHGRPEIPFIIALFFAFGLHLVVKVLIATEASRRINQDRQSGALELLLATPISVDAILSGQKKALLRHFTPALAVLVVVNVALAGVMVTDVGPLHMDAESQGMFSELFIGGLLVLVTDFYALGWVGMWRGLNAVKHHRAVIGTIGRILGPCWLAIFFFIFAQPRLGGQGEVEFMFALWFAAGAVVDVLFGLHARNELHAEFRRLAAQRF
jgi:ABC-type transport system involved in multi-copper enzyme maturation permease subunit